MTFVRENLAPIPLAPSLMEVIQEDSVLLQRAGLSTSSTLLFSQSVSRALRPFLDLYRLFSIENLVLTASMRC
jgi:hypothetical protein